MPIVGCSDGGRTGGGSSIAFPLNGPRRASGHVFGLPGSMFFVAADVVDCGLVGVPLSDGGQVFGLRKSTLLQSVTLLPFPADAVDCGIVVAPGLGDCGFGVRLAVVGTRD